MKKALLIISITAVVFSFGACKEKEEPAPRKTESPAYGMKAPASMPVHGSMDKKTEMQVIVPPEVKGRWTEVKFSVEDKKENTSQEFTVAIGDEFKIPGSDLTIKTGPFLPDFKMSGQIITSASNDPKNPAIGVAIYERDKKIFPQSGRKWGWLYINFPTIHSFQHERYALTFVEAIKKQP
ncbi:MAG: DUF2155 domain-containing protein [Deferribacteres bacterium]|nr:DUF2155 domain-containing protein [Deferribacteres bacterium]